MNILKLSIATICLASIVGCSSSTVAEDPAPTPTPAPAVAATPAVTATPAAAPQGEAIVASVETTATVKAINQTTREVTLKFEDGTENTFTAGPDVRNLAQVKAGDVLRVVYAESIAYEVKKGGVAIAPSTAVAGGRSEVGETRPGAALARQTSATVIITAIDPSVPSVTFMGPAGNTRTVKVLRPEKLQGVSVGDTVELTYTEALAIKVEDAPAK